MFDVGFGELLVCAIVALLVLGPERLPGAVRTAGRWIGRARHTVNHFTDQIDRELRAEELRRRIEEEMQKVGVKEMTKEVDDVSRQVSDALRAPLPLPLVGADHLRDTGNTIASPADIPQHDTLPPPAVPADANGLIAPTAAVTVTETPVLPAASDAVPSRHTDSKTPQ